MFNDPEKGTDVETPEIIFQFEEYSLGGEGAFERYHFHTPVESLIVPVNAILEGLATSVDEVKVRDEGLPDAVVEEPLTVTLVADGPSKSFT